MIKRAEEFAEKEKREFVIEELEKIQRELNENVYSVTSIQSPFIRAKDMNEIIDKHISEVKGGK